MKTYVNMNLILQINEFNEIDSVCIVNNAT